MEVEAEAGETRRDEMETKSGKVRSCRRWQAERGGRPAINNEKKRNKALAGVG